MTHLFILPNNLAPYQINRLNAVAEAGVKIKVITIKTRQHSRPWVDNNATLFAVRSAPPGMEVSDINRELTSSKVKSVTFSGYGQPFRSLIVACKRSKVRKGIFLDSFSSKRPSLIKEYYKKWFIPRHISYFIAPGQQQASYIRNLVDSPEVIISPYIPYEYQSISPPREPSEGSFLCISRLSPEKNIRTLLHAYKAYREMGGCKPLVLAGDGPSKAEIIQEIGVLGLKSHVELTGWLSQDDIKKLFKCAYALVLPSTYEPFGVVVSEALQHGVPVITSSQCGANDAVASHFRNALVFKPSSVPDLVRCLQMIDRDKLLFSRLKEEAISFSMVNNVHTAVAPIVNFFNSIDRNA